MPGLSLIFDQNRDLENEKGPILQALEEVCFIPGYRKELLHRGKSMWAAFTGYAGYPLTVIRAGRHDIFLEGRIYGPGGNYLRRELSLLAEKIFTAGDGFRSGLARHLLGTDGDYLVLFIDNEAGEAAVLNDALGRLPLYYYHREGRFMLSREQRFITRLIPDPRMERRALAQYLLLGYPLGDNTLLRDIHRLKPASLIRIRPGGPHPAPQNIHRFNFEEKQPEGQKRREITAQLIEIFGDSCRRRTEVGVKNIVTLSGGLDSRTVAAGLRRGGIPFRALTFIDQERTAARDAEVAERLARVLEIDWELIPLRPASGQDALDLLRMKCGMNYLAMGFAFQFFRRLESLGGSAVRCFFGEGGDKVLPDLRPHARLRDCGELARYLIGENQIMPLDTVSALTAVPSGEIISELAGLLEGYPEKSMSGKYVDFLITERSIKYLFEGEDRNRYYNWTASPFYSIHFFTRAMSCPDRLKSRHRLYRDFLLALSPRLSAVDYANWKVPISSPRYLLYFLARDLYYRLPASMKQIIKRRHKRTVDQTNLYPPGSNARRCFQTQLEGCTSLGRYLSPEAIETHLPGLNKFAFDHLFTAVSLLEELEGGKSTLQDYRDDDLL
ncbi:MAG: hypothetical protein JXB45_00640 [Candidatus Krumholzibacteriota bacterium]|nr:hypothetical protein [Candidatus Krumholzibacteriota bacterium]